MAASTDFADWSDDYYITSVGMTGLNLNTDSVGVVVWIYATDTAKPNIICENVGNDSLVYLDNSAANNYISTFLSGTTHASTTTTDYNAWTHIAMTFDTSTVKLYKNGVQILSTSATGTNSSKQLRFGINKFGNAFGGYMSDPQVFNRVLSVDEINELMYKPLSIMNSCIWAPDFRDPTAATFADLSGNGVTTTVTGSPATSVLGPPVHFPQMIGS